MPFKLNHDRRHHIPRQKRKVVNWRDYDANLRQRGSLTVWLTDEAVEGWRAAPCTTPGGQPWYSPLAILTALTLRAVFRLALRQAEGLIGSIMHLLGLALRVPDHSTLSRRAATLEVPRPSRSSTGAGGEGEPIHLLVDSTGLKLCGAGEWLIEKHGTQARRSWRKLHIGLDADTGQIVAAALTAKHVDDAAQVGPLLDQVTGAVAAFTADGAYDQSSTYDDVAQRHPDAAVVVPPRATAVPSETAATAPTQRDRHLQCAAEHGRMGWQRAFGIRYEPEPKRPSAGSSRWSGTGCARARTSAGRPRWRSPSTRSTACWSSDARAIPHRLTRDGVGPSAPALRVRATRRPAWLALDPCHGRRPPLHGKMVGARSSDRLRAQLRASVSRLPTRTGRRSSYGADVPRGARDGPGDGCSAPLCGEPRVG